MITIDMSDVGVSLDSYAYQVGETTEQATLRFGVAVGAGLAAETAPKNKKVKQLKERTMAQMRRVVMAVKSKVFFKKLVSGQYHRIKMGGRAGTWVEITMDRILQGPGDINRMIERNRDGRGRTRRLSRNQKYICLESDFNKVVKDRAKRWGVAKGGWLGAATRISRLQQGLDKNRIGKNFQRIGQRHLKVGNGKRTGRDHDTTVYLHNNADAVRYSEGLTTAGVNAAIRRAYKRVFAYYKGELKRREHKRKQGA